MAQEIIIDGNSRRNKGKTFNAFHRTVLVLSSFLISITLIISWVLWFSFYREKIDAILVAFTKTFLEQQGCMIKFQFQDLTIVTLILASLFLVTGTMPFIFLKKKGLLAFLWGLLGLIVALAIILGSAWFFYYFYYILHDFFEENSNLNLLIVIVPWGSVLIVATIFCLNCIWLLLSIIFGKKNTTDQQIATINKNVNTEVVNAVAPITMSGFNDPYHLNQQPEKSPINIVITNNCQPTSSETTKIATDNTSSIATTWTAAQIENIWNKGFIIPNYNKNLYRKDYAGALMFRNSFVNNFETIDNPKGYYWTIVHQRPIVHGGSQNIDNLHPMNVYNAITKGNNYPRWKTSISYNGKENYSKQQVWKDRKF